MKSDVVTQDRGPTDWGRAATLVGHHHTILSDADQIRRSADAGEPTLPTLEQGSLIGRYVVVSLLCRGGMGVVYRAYDPDLNRQVAIKLVRLGVIAADTRDQARLRMLREARVLAKLSHPNVVAIYDVGTVGEDVFLAMEFIEGSTLRKWMLNRSRTRLEILRVFRAAGEGLAAAHKVGVVHRDFKPENVMVGADGRVRVLDFGLARLARAQTNRASRRSLPNMPLASASSDQLTDTGTVLGTPAYMSPEQDAGLDAGMASDQFSFCVALYEALFGCSPYRGTTYLELSRSRADGDVIPPPPLPGVSSRARRALLVGLRPAPKDRHSSIDVLIAELDNRRWASRRGATAIAAALVVGIGASWMVWQSTTEDAGAACALIGKDANKLWNPQRRARIVASLTPRHHAERANAVAEAVDRWVGDWIVARRELCELARKVDPAQEQNGAERLQCLQRRRSELDASLLMLEPNIGNPTLIARAPEIIARMPRVADCATLASLAPSEADSQAEMQIIAQVARAGAARDATKLDEAVALASSAVDLARTTRSSTIAIALRALGDAQTAHGDLGKARMTYRDAALAAAEIHDDGMVADIWLSIVQLSLRDHILDDNLQSAMFAATVAFARLADDDERRPRFYSITGTLQLMQGELDEAVKSLERAIGAWTQLGPERYANDIGAARNSLGLVHADRGEWAEAKIAFEASANPMRANRVDALRLGISLSSLALLSLYQERFAEAEALQRQALVIYHKLPNGHPLIGHGKLNLAEISVAAGHCDRATSQIATARSALQDGHGADSPTLAMAQWLEGVCLIGHDPKAAVALLTRARAIAVAHPVTTRELPEIDFALARAIVAAGGHRADALAHATAARAAFVAVGAGTAARVRAIDRWRARST